MADVAPLNYLGNEKLSNYLSDYIAAHYDIPDRRGMNAYNSWDKNLEYYEHLMMDHKIKQCTDWNQYAEFLNNAEDLSVALTLDGNYDAEMVREKLKQIGLDPSKGDMLWMIRDGECIYSGKGDSKGIWHMDFEENSFAFVTTEETDASGNSVYTHSMVYNTQKQEKVENGINIFVYDSYTKTHIQTIGLDTKQDGTMVK